MSESDPATTPADSDTTSIISDTSSSFTVTETDASPPPLAPTTTPSITTSDSETTPTSDSLLSTGTRYINTTTFFVSVTVTSAPTPSIPFQTHVRPGIFHGRDLIGGVVGGFAAGALIALAIFLFLRRRRRRTLNATPSPALVFDGEKKQLLAQLSNVEAERAQLRTYLQVNDFHDPQEIVDLFNKLNISIRNLCLTNSNNILKAIKSNSSWTTKNASNMMQLQAELVGAPGLVISEKDVGRTPQEFLPEAFRFIVNSTLDHYLFHLFHPQISQNENNLLLNMYHQIRSHDSQRLAARWRCSTYSAIDSRLPVTAEQDWSNQFADNVLGRFTSVIASLFGDVVIPEKLHRGLFNVGREAYSWNRTTKATFRSLDFKPVVFTSVNPFDPASMALYQSHRPKEVPIHAIIAGVSMALMSIAAVSSGEGINIVEECVWQTKAEVLTEGFF